MFPFFIFYAVHLDEILGRPTWTCLAHTLRARQDIDMNLMATPGRMLARLLEPLGRAMTPATAREILAAQADEGARQRIQELAERCDQGLLTPEERAEYQLFVEVGDCVALLQTRARLLLAGLAGQ